MFRWLRDPRYAPDAASAPSTPEGSRFLPVEIIDAKPATDTPVAQNRIDIELSGGHRMRIGGSYDPDTLARLIRGLSV